jgi:hypothetical protein
VDLELIVSAPACPAAMFDSGSRGRPLCSQQDIEWGYL